MEEEQRKELLSDVEVGGDTTGTIRVALLSGSSPDNANHHDQ
jgi:hypothetical protein